MGQGRRTDLESRGKVGAGLLDAFGDYGGGSSDTGWWAWLRWILMILAIAVVGISVVLTLLLMTLWLPGEINKRVNKLEDKVDLIAAGGCDATGNALYKCDISADCPGVSFKAGVPNEKSCLNGACAYFSEPFLPFVAPGQFANYRCKQSIAANETAARHYLVADAVFISGSFEGCVYHNPCGDVDDDSYQLLVRDEQRVVEEAAPIGEGFKKLGSH